ncbi:MAG: hypothetical protein JEZ09_13215 [Salinivirgaceae bacterium]|nr:hypothetical protein [Salinivirgaceae bacterium]
MKTNYIIISLIVLIGTISSCRKSDYQLPTEGELINDNGLGTGTVTWTKDMDLILEGFVFVNDGQTLTIEPGTVIRFKEGQGATASALIIARGGKIIANGTQNEPIIFTAESDNLNGSIAKDTSGLWGGLIILGQAEININNGTSFIEGIPINEPRGAFGGTNNDDNSGELSYLSIRYPGTFLHEGNEINGLTLGGVGSKTSIHHIEIINSADDGIEIFGGSVNLKHIVSLNAHDDAIDYDLGYQGNAQFFLAIQNSIDHNNLIEGSGSIEPVNSNPISNPTFSNFTLLGSSDSENGTCATFNRYSAGKLVNSIIINSNSGILVEYSGGNSDSYNQWKNGHLKIENNIFYNVANNIADSIFLLNGSTIPNSVIDEWALYFSYGLNLFINPEISIENNNIDPFPKIQTNENLYELNSWFETTNYKGAFGTFDWTEGWTAYKKHL